MHIGNGLRSCGLGAAALAAVAPLACGGSSGGSGGSSSTASAAVLETVDFCVEQLTWQ